MRIFKNYYATEDNTFPCEDPSKARLAVKLSQKQRDLTQRNESAHQNAIAHLPLLASTTLLFVTAGAPSIAVHCVGLAYTDIQVAYAAA